MAVISMDQHIPIDKMSYPFFLRSLRTLRDTAGKLPRTVDRKYNIVLFQKHPKKTEVL